MHPQAKPSMAASILREQNKLQQSIKLPEADSIMSQFAEQDDDASSDDSLSSTSEEEEEEVQPPPPKRRGHMPKREALDPMDPSAYSNCPRLVKSQLNLFNFPNTSLDFSEELGPLVWALKMRLILELIRLLLALSFNRDHTQALATCFEAIPRKSERKATLICKYFKSINCLA